MDVFSGSLPKQFFFTTEENSKHLQIGIIGVNWAKTALRFPVTLVSLSLCHWHERFLKPFKEQWSSNNWNLPRRKSPFLGHIFKLQKCPEEHISHINQFQTPLHDRKVLQNLWMRRVGTKHVAKKDIYGALGTLKYQLNFWLYLQIEIIQYMWQNYEHSWKYRTSFVDLLQTFVKFPLHRIWSSIIIGDLPFTTILCQRWQISGQGQGDFLNLLYLHFPSGTVLFLQLETLPTNSY